MKKVSAREYDEMFYVATSLKKNLSFLFTIGLVYAVAYGLCLFSWIDCSAQSVREFGLNLFITIWAWFGWALPLFLVANSLNARKYIHTHEPMTIRDAIDQTC